MQDLGPWTWPSPDLEGPTDVETAPMPSKLKQPCHTVAQGLSQARVMMIPDQAPRHLEAKPNEYGPVATQL